MEQYFSVGEAARAVHTTSETLRHYDRIGLVKPARKDAETRYRYYTRQDLVRLQTVRALQQMDLPLKEIQTVLEYDDLEKIVDFLVRAENRADEKIAALQESKAKIRLARADYAQKLRRRDAAPGVFRRTYPERVILLSDTLEAPTLDTLWNYLGHFYAQIPPEVRERFSFADLAGVYTENGASRMFALCTRHGEAAGLRRLPPGDYLCADCAEEGREQALRALLDTARTEYGAEPRWSLQLIVVSGILQWKYQIQVPLL